MRPADLLPATNELELVIGLPLRNKGALADLLREVYDPTSANYRRYLTSEQFTERFGPTVQDYQAVIAFAEAHSMKITATHPNRTLLDVRASVAAIEKTLHVLMRVYEHPREARIFYAPDTDPSLDLGVRVLSIGGLDDFSPPRPMNLRVTPLGQNGPNANPLVAGSGPRGFLVGRDFRSAYAPGVTLDGAGQSVGLLELSTGYYASDITAYETIAGLPSVTLSNVLVNGFSGRPSDGNMEVALDIDVAISMAPGLSSVIVYEGRTPNDILNRMATDNLARQLSSSWTWSGYGNQETTEQIFQQFAAQGQSFFEASGDEGAYCGVINTPADDPYVTVVGGTILTTSQPDGALVAETAWPFGGGGISTNYTIPAWQKGIDMSHNGGSTALRNIPDVACVAQDIWLIANNGEQFSGSGTSASAPLWAGFAALANQRAAATGQPPIGFINPAVYAIGSGPAYASAFHDTTTGNNTNGCGIDKFPSVQGYDLCTGWGTPNGSNLINALLAPLDALQITPSTTVTISGPAGGPFMLPTSVYLLTNRGTASLNWTLVNTSSWLNTLPTSGILTPGGPAATVTLKPNPAASNLLGGSYSTTLCFTNLNNSFGQNRQVILAVITPPVITSQPVDQPVRQGATALFTVSTAPNALQFYQWRQDNGSYLTNLTDGGNVSGAAAGTLMISNASTANVGGYSVVISNAAGSVTSSTAFLSLAPWRPVISEQPTSQTVLPGQTVALRVAASGTQPLFYRWRENGTNISDGGNVFGTASSTITISNVSPANAATYSVVISNALGSVTSSGAVLSVTPVTAPGITVATLYSFSGRTDGANPNGLFQATNGLFYGTTQRGGTNFSGTVFQFIPGSGPMTLHSFTGTNDGAIPFAALVQGPDTNFYGTTYQGGAFDNGTIFRMTPSGVVTTMVSLDLGLGDLPYAGLTLGPDASLYGTGYQGGAGGRGTAFKTTAAGAFTVLYSFTNGVDGGHVAAGLALGDDGYFYGTTYKGGASGNGVVFRVATNGFMTTLASFNKTAGAFPYASLVQGTDGNLYGTTSQGGLPGFGNVFRVSPSGQLTNLYSFTGGTNGGFPVAGLLLANDGNFYGTTAYGGTYGDGTAFRLGPDGTVTTLVQFNGYNGANPQATLAQGADGNLYGTTQNGGASGAGVIFRLGMTGPPQITSQPTSQAVFTGANVRFSVVVLGGSPLSYQWFRNGTNLVDAGNVSGSAMRTASLSGVIPADAAGYSVVISNNLGAVTSSIASLTVTSSAPFITLQPTNQSPAPGVNVTFVVTALGNLPLTYQWQENGTNLTDGGNVSGTATSVLGFSNAIETNNGTYAVVVSNALGSVTSASAALTVVPSSAAGTRLATLHWFNSTSGGGGWPPNGLVQATNGDLYGTTQFGRSNSPSGLGTVFRIDTNGTFTSLVSFAGASGSVPQAALAQGSDGFLYGTTRFGGTNQLGNVFRMTSDGAVSNLYSFSGDIDGSYPVAPVLPAKDGNIYGTTPAGGLYGYGNVFRITPQGGFTNLYSFTGGIDGNSPTGGLAQATDGNFYGLTPYGGAYGKGNAFRITPEGVLTTIYSFSDGANTHFPPDPPDGKFPAGALVQATDGNFYGVTSLGGFSRLGTVFRLTPAGTHTILYEFNGIVHSDGHFPHAGLILGSDGNLYGTTFGDGLGGYGTVFRITTDSTFFSPTFTTLVNLDGFNTGANPEAALTQGADGNLYGTTTTNGPTGRGTVFRLSMTSAPQITLQPASQTVFAGATVNFSVAVFGAPQLIYRWQLNGTNLTNGGNVSGSTSRVLTLANATTANVGTYSVVVSNSLGSAPSVGATLAVNSSPPVITRQPASQTASLGTTATMSVTVNGNLPLVYQWRFDGTNLAGATNSALVLPGVQFANAGNYTVVVTNSLGSVTSIAAGLRVPAVLTFTNAADEVTLTWPAPYVLQSATNVIGPYIDVPRATSPFVVVSTDPRVFFRLRAPIAGTVSALGFSGNQFNMSVSGLPGYRYIVQASTNLTFWMPVVTNPAPFIFTDPSTGIYPRRFYRTVFLP
jgi:uncharacterized repeat protein (TIGR03803 family)